MLEQELYLKLLTITCLSLAWLGFIITSISSNIYANYVGTLMWGSQSSPSGVAVDSSGNVFVASNGNNRILKFQLANPCPTGTTQVVPGVCYISYWGSQGTGKGQFQSAIGVALDSSGNVFVLETGNRIQKFQLANPCPTGTTQVVTGVCFVIEWGGIGPGNPGTSKGQFNDPRGIAVDSSGNVFVSDTFNNRIQKFQLANPCPTGTTQVVTGVCFVIEWGNSGTGNPSNAKGQFDHPHGIAVDSSGNIFVGDTYNNRIQKFQLANPCPTGTTQVVTGVCFVIEWGNSGTGNPSNAKGEFHNPVGVAVDSSGNVYVADGFNYRIQKFQLANPCPTGTTQVPGVPGVCYVTDWGSYSVDCAFIYSFLCHNSPGQFEYPYGIAVDSSGNVFVADIGNDRIHVFIDDIISPTVTITYPINGATLIHNPPIPPRLCIGCPTLNITDPITTNIPPKLQIRATATDNVEVKKVEFFASSANGGNVLVGSDTSSPYSIPLTNLAPDTYTLTAIAYDTADNTKISTPVTVSIK